MSNPKLLLQFMIGFGLAIAAAVIIGTAPAKASAADATFYTGGDASLANETIPLSQYITVSDLPNYDAPNAFLNSVQLKLGVSGGHEGESVNVVLHQQESNTFSNPVTLNYGDSPATTTFTFPSPISISSLYTSAPYYSNFTFEFEGGSNPTDLTVVVYADGNDVYSGGSCNVNCDFSPDLSLLFSYSFDTPSEPLPTDVFTSYSGTTTCSTVGTATVCTTQRDERTEIAKILFLGLVTFAIFLKIMMDAFL